jgi:hypothetical protein
VNTVMNTMFHRMLGISLVIERLFVSQEPPQHHGANYSVQFSVRGRAIAHLNCSIILSLPITRQTEAAVAVAVVG